MRRVLSLSAVILLLWVGLALAATFTSAQSGNWNDGATWGNTSPGTEGTDYPTTAGGDDIIISGQHNIVIPSGHAAKADINTINAGVSATNTILDIQGALTLESDITAGGYFHLKLGAGATLELAGYDLLHAGGYTYGRITIAGTSGSRATVQSTGTAGGRIGAAADGSYMAVSLEYCDFSDLGAVRFNDEANTTYGGAYIDHCTFENCGDIWLYRVDKDTDLTIQYTDFRDCGSTYGPYLRHQGGGTGTFSVTHSTFQGTTSGKPVTWYPYSGGKFEYCVFKNINMQKYDANGSFEHCMFFTGVVTNLLGTLYGGETIDSNFFYNDNDNNRVAGFEPGGQKTTISNNILDLSYADGYSDHGNPFILSNTPVDFTRNLFLDRKGGALVSVVSSARSQTYNIIGNSIVCADPATGAVGLISTQSGGTFTGTVNVYDNLVVDPINSGLLRGVSLDSATADQIDYTDYNNFYQVNDAYANVVITDLTEGVSDGFGANDKAVEPQFVDATRTLATWDDYLGGIGTAENAIAEMLKLNASDFDTDYTITNLMTWVGAGYAPQNSALNGAGRYGADIGAVDYGSKWNGITPAKWNGIDWSNIKWNRM